MAKKSFTYGGYTFEPRGLFADFGLNDDIHEICCKLNNSNFGYVADGDEPYNYDDFYKAAGEKVDDVFLCKENGILYIPCQSSLQIFTPGKHEPGSVSAAYHRRRAAIEEARIERKREELKHVMTPTEEQHQTIIALRHAIDECRKQGLDFAVDGTDLYVFRADLLENLTSDMAPADGQEGIADNLFSVIDNAWDVCEGLYANPKKYNN